MILIYCITNEETRPRKKLNLLVQAHTPGLPEPKVMCFPTKSGLRAWGTRVLLEVWGSVPTERPPEQKATAWGDGSAILEVPMLATFLCLATWGNQGKSPPPPS